MGPINLCCSFDLYRLSFTGILGTVFISVCIWSYYYIDVEEYYNRFIPLLVSFISRMVLLIFFSNMFMTLIGWDLLGVTSFFLIVFYKNRNCAGSGIITALSNRLGDCLIFCVLRFYIMKDHVVVLFLLLVIRLTKRAQFPFSAWLPAAMAAPTPVRALVHSSTLVTAGVFVLIRYCIYDARFIVTIGALTLTVAGICACTQSDLKKIVALRTISQLGIMIVSIGVHEKSICFFHLLSHACFKALLFLCVGIIFHTGYGRQEFRRVGNVRTRLAVSVYCKVAIISLIGFQFTSGFIRKEQILERLYEDELSSLIIILFLTGIGLTSIYCVKILSNFSLDTLVGSSSNSKSVSNWFLRIPLLNLGFFSVCWGTRVTSFVNPFILITSPVDKGLPILIISIGIVTGYLLNRSRSTLFSRLFILTPNTQILSVTPVIVGDLKTLEGFYIGSWNFPTALKSHYKVLGLGLGLIFFYILYDKLDKHCEDITLREGCEFIN